MKDGKFVILCVDDDSDILESLKLVLEANGYIMASAPTAEEGLEVFQAEKPDLLIVDLMMEEIDAGTRFVKDLQALGNTAPIYMLSSVGDELHQSIDAGKLGLAGIFQKPIDPDVLLATLKTKLRKA
ncbi:MAG: response regulator [Deltaproteobacteria bacterium]|nr:response regulator [Deltaproteobacteria bacterium]